MHWNGLPKLEVCALLGKSMRWNGLPKLEVCAFIRKSSATILKNQISLVFFSIVTFRENQV